MRLTVARRPEVFFLAALIALALVATLRSLQPPPPAAPVAPAPAPRDLGDPQMIAQLQARIARNPDDAGAYAFLGLAWLQRVRETADFSLYERAEEAFEAALARDEAQLDALLGQASLALARHQFATALEWGERARAVAPQRAQVYGVLGDAYVELGRYPEALAAIQQMVNIRPDLGSYSRVSYLRELYGDLEGAIEAMELAVDAGAPGAEQSLWARTQLGNLFFGRGEMEQAAEQYALALAEQPGYPYAEAGMARVRAAQGDLAGAARIYEGLVERVPLPEFVIALGEVYTAMGRPADATRQHQLVRAIQQLSAENGTDVDLELALFEADYGDPQAALALARAAYDRRPSIQAADSLAWALFKAGDLAEAARYSGEALRLGTRDPAMRFRAGMIAAVAGDQTQARTHLVIALAVGAEAAPLSSVQAEAARAALR